MTKMMTRLLAAATLCALPAAADAAVTLDVRNGVLMGASGVELGGKTYDVAFTDDSCDVAFAPCSRKSFAFRSRTDARIAAQALLDQVFIGKFDTDPYLTNGCTSSDGVCGTYIPFALANDLDPEIFDDEVFTVGAINSYEIGRGKIEDLAFDTGRNLTDNSTQTYARFSLTAVAAVPEPTTWAMMLAGFGLTGAAMRRRRRTATARVLA